MGAAPSLSRWTRQEDIALVEGYRRGMVKDITLPGRSVAAMRGRLTALRLACPVGLLKGPAEHVVDLCGMDYESDIITRTCASCKTEFPTRRCYNLRLCYGCRRRSGVYRDKRRA